MWRSTLEVVATVVPYLSFWVLACLAFPVSPLLCFALIVPGAFFLVRMFLLQHDCGHGTLYKKRSTNDALGRVLGVFTLTPYDAWKRSHAIHHASSGNLDERGTGDIKTLTVQEYRELSWWGQLQYRVYRNPLILFVLGPLYLFGLQHRLPLHMLKGGSVREWASVIGTNIALVVLYTVLIWTVGLERFLWVQLPMVAIAASIGVWLFYIQHQFEETFWQPDEDWDQHDAALYGSSHYALPGILPWLTAHIGVHHVHHLYSRIPFYHLPKVLKDFPELAEVRRITLWESLKCINLRLWDEDAKRLVSFSEARMAV